MKESRPVRDVPGSRRTEGEGVEPGRDQGFEDGAERDVTSRDLSRFDRF